MSFLDRRVAAFWDRVSAHTSVPAESLSVFRWVFGIFMLAMLAPHNAWIDSMPRAFFDPPPFSMAQLFSTFPPRPTFLVLDALLLVSLCCITVGYRTRTAGLAFIVIDVVTSSFRFSFGKVDHGFLPTAFVACMLIGDWGRYYSFDARRREPTGLEALNASRGVALFAVLVAFAMLSAGLPKAWLWIDFDTKTSGFLSWHLTNYFSLGRSFLLARFALQTPPWAAEIADYLASIFELSGFLALLHSRRAWLAFLMTATAFHLANSLVLNIPFHDNVVLYLAFANWAPLGSRCVKALRPLPRARMALAVTPIGLAIWHLVSRCAGKGSTVVFVVDPVAARMFDLYVSVPIAVGGLIVLTHAFKTAPQALQRLPEQGLGA